MYKEPVPIGIGNMKISTMNITYMTINRPFPWLTILVDKGGTGIKKSKDPAITPT